MSPTKLERQFYIEFLQKRHIRCNLYNLTVIERAANAIKKLKSKKHIGSLKYKPSIIWKNNKLFEYENYEIMKIMTLHVNASLTVKVNR